MEKTYTIEESKLHDLISTASTVHVLIEDVAPEDIFARDVTTKWAELLNEIQELEDKLDDIKNPPEELKYDVIDGKVETWIRETTPIPKFNS